MALNDLAAQVINPDRDTPVDVDLVLDIGNSRTTGILVETLPQRITNLNDSYLLELRDLSQPEHIYADPFETRVEFVDAAFGNDAFSRRSGRLSPAFAWPSSVRIGPEAARLATQAVCAEGTTGMLLCFGPSTQEVQDLPQAVYEWICSTHGETPEQRAGKAPALFFVLTKMDVEFEKKAGSTSEEDRWTIRLESSLLKFFGQLHDWPQNWDGTHPFNNVFLLRNPNFLCEAIFDYADRHEALY
jgi:Uncharacterized protein conserved in bacteria, putative virulence factor